jgi:predicted ATP-binding protein involved in virulence
VRIDRLAVRNVVRFESFDASFSPSFNVIIGENGAGKSSILLLISRALAHWTTARQERLVVEGETRESIVANGGPATRIPHFPRELRIDGIGADNKKWQAVDQNLGGKSQGIRFSGATERLGAGNLDSRARRRLRAAEADVAVSLPMAALFTPWREQPHRKKVPLEPAGPARRLDGYTKAFDLHADFKSFAAWFKTLEMQRIEDGETSPVLEAARTSVVRCLPDCTDVRWVPRINDILVTLGKETHPAWRLSDGYRTMLALVGELAWRAAVLNPGLGEHVAQNVEGVVLIDEIDLHLHPRWQRRVVADLRQAFPQVQFIATTHSPFVVQSMRADEVINLDREPSLDFQQSSVEDIVEVEMGVEGVQRSQVFHDKVAAARDYLEALERKPKDAAELTRLKARLDELQLQFGNDPVYVASLLQKRAAKGLE